jgi:hypothetical protein
MTDRDNHPAIEDLLQFLDQGRSTRSSRMVERHVSGCWKCRSRVEEIEATIRDFARYHEKILLPSLPAAARPWPDLRLALRQFDDVNPELGAWTRMANSLRGPGGPAKRRIVAGLAVACAGLALTLSARVWLRPAATPSPAVRGPVEQPAPPPSKEKPTAVASMRRLSPGTTPPGSATTLELLAFAALHRAGADLGDPVEVIADTGGGVRVRAIGLTPERQESLREALAATPQVQIDFGQPGPAVPSRVSGAGGVTVAAGRSPFQVQVQRILGGGVTWEQYGNRVLDESDAVLARAHALGTLADHFPAVCRARFDDTERALIEEIEHSHRQVLREHASALYILLVPVRDGLSSSPATVVPAGMSVLDAARRLDRVVSILFGVAPTDQSPADVAAELRQAMAELKSAAGSRE